MRSPSSAPSRRLGRRRRHGAGWVRPDARAAWHGADDGYQAIVARLAAGAFDCVDAAVILQNHDPAAIRRVPRFCNGLFISLAPNLGRGSNFVVVAEKNEAVKRHSVLPTFL